MIYRELQRSLRFELKVAIIKNVVVFGDGNAENFELRQASFSKQKHKTLKIQKVWRERVVYYVKTRQKSVKIAKLTEENDDIFYPLGNS